MRARVAASLISGSLLLGGGAGAVLFGPTSAVAQSSSSDSQSTQSGALPADPLGHPPRGPHARPNLAVAAATIGISEADLKTALQSGQSLAAVATANNVDPQTVIDALVADAQSNLAARVAGGDLTQAQADQISADLVQRITDHVNQTGGPGGAGCPGMDGSTVPADPGSSSSSTSASNT